MANRKLIVVSFDALVYEDLDKLKNLPCFSNFWNKGSRVNRIRTIYPSLTYPAHTSILTGVPTGKHSIVNNEPFKPGQKNAGWFWFHDSVTAKDIHDVAKEAGLKTCSLFWPVTGNHKSVDYLIDEYWPQFKGDTLEAAYKRAGTSDELYEFAMKGREEAFKCFDSRITDEAETDIACDIIKKYNPDLLTLHLTLVDSTRHVYGEFNDMVEKAAAKTESFISRIVQATKDAGTFEQTNFVITSDHGQINYTRRLFLNKKFIEDGFIRVDEQGNVTDWDVWMKSACFSSHIYLKNPEDKALYDKVYKYLKDMEKAGNMGIGRVLTTEQAKEKYGLYGDFSFVLESDQTTIFGENWQNPTVWIDCPPEDPNSSYGRATHGHDPDVGPQPVFVCWGPQIKQGVVLPKANIIDEAPTFAAILGLSFPQAQGRVLSELLC